MPSLARLLRLCQTPALPSMASRSALEKLCFSSALPTEPHPSLARLLRLCQTPALLVQSPSTAWRRSGLRGKLALPERLPSPLASRSVLEALLRRLRRPGACPRLGLCTPSLARPRGFANPQPCHPWQVVRPSKSFAFRRLCRPSLTPPWRDREASLTPSLAIHGKSFGPRKALLFVGFADRASPILGAKVLASLTPSPAIHGKSFGPRKALLFVGFADRASPILGAKVLASLTPSLAIHGKSFGPRKALLFVGCADRVLALDLVCACHPWRDREASLTPSLAILGKSFGLRKALLFVGCADRASPLRGSRSQHCPL